MLLPFDPKTCKVSDLCRSRDNYPYELPYGYTLNTTFVKYDEIPATSTFESILPEADRQLHFPLRYLTNSEIGNIIAFSKENLPDFTSYEEGYKQGWEDVNSHLSRNTFAQQLPHTLAFCIGYEMGIYVAVLKKINSKKKCVMPELDFYLQHCK